MKKTLALAAVAAFGLTGAASADLTFDLGTFSLTGSLAGPTNDYTFSWTGYLEGFSFSGDYSEDPVNATYASDTRLRVYLDGVEVYHIGGFTDPGADWDFQGVQSNAPGFYAHGLGGAPWGGDGNHDGSISGSGDWEFVFTNGWHSDATTTQTWSNASLVLANAIPAPGALALLGLAGLVGARRRRA